jgi:hypothetical protein
LTVGVGAQSIGGLGGFGAQSTNGGGAGGAAGAGGNTQIFLNGGTITTYQYAAVGALAMSVGGTGGSGAAAAGTFHRDGGNGAIGGDGGIANISLGNSGAGYQVVQTSDQDSDALVALSVGGGGGYGGKVIGGGAGITISLGGQEMAERHKDSRTSSGRVGKSDIALSDFSANSRSLRCNARSASQRASGEITSTTCTPLG